jgi:hypothetical protein
MMALSFVVGIMGGILVPQNFGREVVTGRSAAVCHSVVSLI